MNQEHSQNVSHVSIDVNLMVENVTPGKNEIMISASVIKSIKQRVCEENYV